MQEWYVSLADVVQHPSYGKDGTLESILYSYGMDVSKGFKDDGRWKLKSTNTEDFDEFDYYHKSLSGDIVKCPRYVGVARTDGGWFRFINRFLDLPVEFTRRGGKNELER